MEIVVYLMLVKNVDHDLALISNNNMQESNLRDCVISGLKVKELG